MKSAAGKLFFKNISLIGESKAIINFIDFWRNEYKIFLLVAALFLTAYFFPVEYFKSAGVIYPALDLAKWYAREHVLLCLVPAFFIAGVIAVFISQASVVKYFGAGANKILSYMIASVSGSVLAVCSCTILPLFSGIHKRGAGIGPATAFLYSGPAINILGIILTARILGFELGVARVIAAVFFSVIIGLLMSFIYRKEEKSKPAAEMVLPGNAESQPLWKTSLHFFILAGILVFVNWGKPGTEGTIWDLIYSAKWILTGILSLGLIFSLIYFVNLKITHVISAAAATVVSIIFFYDNPLIPFTVGAISLGVILSASEGEGNDWMNETWGFTKQILPLLAIGILAAGFLLGSPENPNGIIPNNWISNMAGGNSLLSNLVASVAGAFMYFATLTEIPIVQGLMNSGMGKGPALALLLSGPALSLPSIIVLRSILGTQKTIVYTILVIVTAAFSGMIFGNLF